MLDWLKRLFAPKLKPNTDYRINDIIDTIQIGTRISYRADDGVVRCCKCGSMNELVEPTVGTVTAIDRKLNRIEFSMDYVFKCGCCGNEETTMVGQNDRLDLGDALCQGIVKPQILSKSK